MDLGMGARPGLKAILIGIVAALLVTTSSPLSQAGGHSSDAGVYIRDGVKADLTKSHIAISADRVAVDAPAGTSQIRVKTPYLEERLGAWAADRPFTIDSETVVVNSDEVTLTTFTPDSDDVFTVGSDSSLRFLDRPMWVSVRPIEDGLEISAHDGSTTGQEIRLDKAWLAEYGLTAPIAVHEDGTVLDVSATVDGTGFIVDVPHFSGIKVLNPDLDQSWMYEGFTFYYDADSGQSSSEFKVTVAEVGQSDITFRFWHTTDGSDTTFDEDQFDRDTRKSTDRTGLNGAPYYSFNFVNNDNLENGVADLGTGVWELTLVSTNAYVFTRTGSDLEYHYDLDEGWLRKVEDTGSAAAISIYSWGTGSVPTGPLDQPEEAQLTSKSGLIVEAGYDDFDNIQHAFPRVEEWSGGDSDERVRGNILSDTTTVEATADVWVFSWVDTYPPQQDSSDPVPCMDREIDDEFCHVQALMTPTEDPDLDAAINFHVHWPDGGDSDSDESSSQIRTNCTGTECEWNGKQWSWGITKSITLDGEVHHGLLGIDQGITRIDFWLCGRASVWIDAAVGSDDPTALGINCLVHESSRSGQIIVDARPLT